VQDVWSPNGPQQDTPPTPLPPSLPGRQSRRDGSLTMMTGETGFEGPVILRLTDAGRPLIEPHDVGHGAFAGWCWSAPVCFSLRSDLRSYGGSPGPYVMTTAGVRVAPKHATFPLTIDLCRSPALHGAVVTAIVSARWWAGRACPHVLCRSTPAPPARIPYRRLGRPGLRHRPK
jgi:hypothetical protein